MKNASRASQLAKASKAARESCKSRDLGARFVVGVMRKLGWDVQG